MPREDEYLRVLREPASLCSSNVYVSMIPHPSEWKEGDGVVKLWQMEGGSWKEL